MKFVRQSSSVWFALTMGLSACFMGGCGPVERSLSRHTPEYTALDSESNAPATVEEWRSDIRLLGRELPRRIPHFYMNVDSVEFAAEIDAAAEAVSESLAAVNVLQLYRLLAASRFGGGHTGINPLQKSLGWHFYPFVAYEFDDGVYVI